MSDTGHSFILTVEGKTVGQSRGKVGAFNRALDLLV
jgi:hypothetical protein